MQGQVGSFMSGLAEALEKAKRERRLREGSFYKGWKPFRRQEIEETPGLRGILRQGDEFLIGAPRSPLEPQRPSPSIDDMKNVTGDPPNRGNPPTPPAAMPPPSPTDIHPTFNAAEHAEMMKSYPWGPPQPSEPPAPPMPPPDDRMRGGPSMPMPKVDMLAWALANAKAAPPDQPPERPNAPRDYGLIGDYGGGTGYGIDVAGYRDDGMMYRRRRGS